MLGKFWYSWNGKGHFNFSLNFIRWEVKIWNSIEIYTTFHGVTTELDVRYKENIWFLKFFSTVWQSELPVLVFFFSSFSRRIALSSVISIRRQLPHSSAVPRTLLWDQNLCKTWWLHGEVQKDGLYFLSLQLRKELGEWKSLETPAENEYEH